MSMCGVWTYKSYRESVSTFVRMKSIKNPEVFHISLGYRNMDFGYVWAPIWSKTHCWDSI